ncbi:MAG: 30S ribosomal protein S21 [Planctomycetota bacterium]
MIRVQVRPNEPLEAALRRFKRQCNYAGIFRLAKKHAYHEKSSDKKRREDRERLRNIMMAERKRNGTSGGRSNKKRRTRGGKGKERRNDQPDFDPLTADTTLDHKAATEAGNLVPATATDAAAALNAASTAPAAPSES